jgi:hypothetical protein
MSIVVSHGEGYADFGGVETGHAALCGNRGDATETCPLNPNVLPQGITGLTTSNGRFTIIMPHPRRVFRTVQNSGHPYGWLENGAWMRMFQNARDRNPYLSLHYVLGGAEKLFDTQVLFDPFEEHASHNDTTRQSSGPAGRSCW